METDNKIRNLNAKGIDVKFKKPNSGAVVSDCEAMLNVVLPSDYRRFLENFGYLDGPGFEIFGIPEDSSTRLSVVSNTLEERSYGLPKNYIVIGSIGDGSRDCIKISDSGLCSVVVLMVQDLSTETSIFDTFEDYVNEALDGAMRDIDVFSS